MCLLRFLTAPVISDFCRCSMCFDFVDHRRHLHFSRRYFIFVNILQLTSASNSLIFCFASLSLLLFPPSPPPLPSHRTLLSLSRNSFLRCCWFIRNGWRQVVHWKLQLAVGFSR